MYIPHAQAVCEHVGESTQEDKRKADLLHNVSWYYRVHGFHDTAARMASEAITIRKRALGEEDEATLASIHSLARILFEQGKLHESEELQLPAIEICKRKFGEEHEITLRNQGHLAAIRGMQKRYEEAHELQKEILEKSKRVAESKPETKSAIWLAMRDLAITLSYMDRKAEAEELQTEVYNARREHLGEDHPETLIIMSDLATTYIERSDISKAEDLLTKVLDHSRRILGEKHPHTLAAIEDLKQVLKSAGKFDEVWKLEDDLRRIERDLKESTKPNDVDKRPTSKRTMSSSVYTYAYRRSSTTLNELSDDTQRENTMGLGISLDDDEEEDALPLSRAVILLTKGILSVPAIDISIPVPDKVPVTSTEESTSRPSMTAARQHSSITTRDLYNTDNPLEMQPASEVKEPRLSRSSTTQSSDKAPYSDIKAIRSIQKKVDRSNLSKEAADLVLSQGLGLVKEVSTSWKTGFKDLKIGKSKNKKDEEDGSQK